MDCLLPELFGNDKSKEILCSSIKGGRMPQTLILEGDSGSGKHTFAIELAKAMFCSGDESQKSFPCEKCRRCERVKNLLTPDLVFVRAEESKTSIPVDSVREMTAQALVGPCEMPVLVFIVEGADNLTVQAQNAWLLALENPPEDVVYILLCENSAKLLETIRSRSFIFRMERFSPEAISGWILANTDMGDKHSREDIYDAANAANGSIGRALMLLSDNSMSEFHEKRADALKIAKVLFDKSLPKAHRLKAVYSLSKKRAMLTEYFLIIKEIIHDMILLKVDENALLSFFTGKEREEALTLSDMCSLKTLYEYNDAVNECLESLNMNASVNGVRTDFIIKTGMIK